MCKVCLPQLLIRALLILICTASMLCAADRKRPARKLPSLPVPVSQVDSNGGETLSGPASTQVRQLPTLVPRAQLPSPAAVQPQPADPSRKDSYLELAQPKYTLLRDLTVNTHPELMRQVPSAARRVFATSTARESLPGNEELWERHIMQQTHVVPYHLPLYFEDPNLERYGISHGWVQPAISGGLFFSTIPSLPYRLTASPPSRVVQTEFQDSPASFREYLPPRDPFAAAVQAAATSGLFFLIP